MTTKIGFLIGLKIGVTDHEIWLFPDDIPSKYPDKGTMTYTMTNGSDALLLGDSTSVGAFVTAILGSMPNVVDDAAAGVVTELTKQLRGLPEPFSGFLGSAIDILAGLTFHLESLRLMLSWETVAGTKKYTAGYEMGVSVSIEDLKAPGPLSAFTLKGIYLKLAS